jgi:hypothetical protein
VDDLEYDLLRLSRDRAIRVQAIGCPASAQNAFAEIVGLLLRLRRVRYVDFPARGSTKPRKVATYRSGPWT